MSDLIDRQAVLEVVKSMPNDNPSYWNTCDVINREDTLDEIENLPSVTPTERTGHWIEKEDFNGDTYYDCSECGESFCLIDGTPTDNLYNFCPNCGADMRGDTE